MLKAPPVTPPVPLTILSGDDYGPYVCAALDGASLTIDAALYSVSSRWPKRAAEHSNVLQRLLNAPSRGVRCSAVLAAHRKHSSTAAFNVRAANVLRDHGWRVRWSPQSRLLHAKYICIDRQLVILGSHNIAHTAVARNIDLSVAFHSPSAAQEFIGWYAGVFAKAKVSR